MKFSTVLSMLTIGAAAAFAPNAPAFTRQSSSMFMADGDLVTGNVKWFNTVKGFGFITPDDGSDDVFVHQTEIQSEGFRSLADGEQVEFKMGTDEKTGRSKAVGVTGPDGTAVQGAPFRPRYDDEGY
eukprot:CAMPEP_0195269446 /NCGR_PEP_ID=MMETSP0706-20130129/13777_1 /TAXON_ID=33640 /ORGANISM="Asterionellopsis glacialis, Strain CCMP134" /LENGTH=126 /DNA_ID=CAMNT_0040324563 /DNA_START=55 /DNA_END=435 /DNA_ORIENTATION=-